MQVPNGQESKYDRVGATFVPSFLNRALNCVRSKQLSAGSYNFRTIWGVPGAGKTRAIKEFINALNHGKPKDWQYRFLVVVPTNRLKSDYEGVNCEVDTFHRALRYVGMRFHAIFIDEAPTLPKPYWKYAQ